MRKFLLICLASAVWLELAASFKILRTKRSSEEILRRCYKPPDSGPCRASFENYFYNATSDECETFIYGGCLGNDNNFPTKDVCEGVCLEYMTDDDDYNKWQVSDPPTSYPPTSDPPTSDPPTSDPPTEGKDGCEYPQDEGGCRRQMRYYQYYFDGDSCERFLYRGCRGNPNTFDTEEECMERCGPNHEVESDNEM